MAIATSIILVFLAIIIILIAGTVLLQIKLSKISKRMGLILPAIFLGIAIMALLGVTLFSSMQVTEYTENGGGIVERVIASTDIPSVIFAGIAVFVLYNIPTVILYVIHRTVRHKHESKQAVDNMKLHDL